MELEVYFTRHLDQYKYIHLFYKDEKVLARSETKTTRVIAEQIFRTYPPLFDVQRLNFFKRLCYRIHIGLFIGLFKRDMTRLVAERIQACPSLKNTLGNSSFSEAHIAFEIQDDTLRISEVNIERLSSDEFYAQLSASCSTSAIWNQLEIEGMGTLPRPNIERLLAYPLKPAPKDIVQTVENLRKLELFLDEQDQLDPIFGAMLMGRKDLYTELLKNTDINHIDSQGRSLLQYACFLGNLELATYLLENGANASYQTPHFDAPLFQVYACSLSKEQKHLLLNLLYEKGADKEQLDTRGWSLIQTAIVRQDLDTVKFLVEKGTSFTTPSKQGSPLKVAVYSKNEEIFRYILEKLALINAVSQEMPALIAAIQEDKLEIIRHLIVYFTDNQRYTDGRTPLMYAAILGKTRIVRYLIEEQKVDLEAKANDGSTALNYCFALNQFEIAALLLKNGARFDHLDNKGFTPLISLKNLNTYPASIHPHLATIKQSLAYKATQELLRRQLIANVFELTSNSHCPINNREYELEGFCQPAIYPIKKIVKHVTSHHKLFSAVALEGLEQALETFDPQTILDRLNQGLPVVVKSGYGKHIVTFIIWKDYFILCNRGGSNRNKKSFEIFEFDSQLFTAENVSLLKPQKDGLSYLANLDDLASAMQFQRTSLTQLLEEQLNLPLQIVGNCPFANSEGALLPLSVLDQGLTQHILHKDFSLIEVAKLCSRAKREHHQWLLDFQQHVIGRYLSTKINEAKLSQAGIDLNLIDKVFERFPHLKANEELQTMFEQVK